LHEANTRGTRTVMVASGVAREGKTTLATHLAGSLARAGCKTLLIDCDLRRPSVHPLFDLPAQPGLCEVLLQQAEAASAARPTTIPGLAVLPAGRWNRLVLQSLAQGEAGKLFEQLKQDYDFLVIDSHPVLLAADSLLVGQNVDAVILSLLRDVSQAPVAYAACQRLTTLGIRVLGAVVHGMPQKDLYQGSYRYAPVAAGV